MGRGEGSKRERRGEGQTDEGRLAVREKADEGAEAGGMVGRGGGAGVCMWFGCGRQRWKRCSIFWWGGF